MIRRPYRTSCRFFSDSNETNTIHWYVVPWSNGTLPFPHRIKPNDWYPEQVNPKDIGEESLEDRPFDGWGRIIPPVPTTDHICGTADDFSNGCARNSSRPPLNRAGDGIPDCCRQVIQGMVMGGFGQVLVGRSIMILNGGTFYFTAVNDCASSPQWNFLTQGRIAVINRTGAFGFPTTIINGFVGGQSYRIDVYLQGTGQAVSFIGGGCSGHSSSFSHFNAQGSLHYSDTFTFNPTDAYVMVRVQEVVSPPGPGYVVVITPL